VCSQSKLRLLQTSWGIQFLSAILYWGWSLYFCFCLSQVAKAGGESKHLSQGFNSCTNIMTKKQVGEERVYSAYTSILLTSLDVHYWRTVKTWHRNTVEFHSVVKKTQIFRNGWNWTDMYCVKRSSLIKTWVTLSQTELLMVVLCTEGIVRTGGGYNIKQDGGLVRWLSG
jgi:hypothetical protein